VIDVVKLKIDLMKMEAIMKCPVLTNYTEVRSSVGESQYLWKFIASFSTIVAPLHAIAVSGKSFQWRKNQHKDFNELKRNVTQALPNL
jgi:hypothetical protein